MNTDTYTKVQDVREEKQIEQPEELKEQIEEQPEEQIEEQIEQSEEQIEEVEDKESTKKRRQKAEECIELKNINYKNMLMTGNTLSDLTTKHHTSMDNLDKYLKQENLNNKNEQWCKLNKTTKIEKLVGFANNCKETKGWTDEDVKLSIDFFKKCLDRKKLQRVKDVSYDKEKGEIKDIPSLVYDKGGKHFTLKNMEKHVSTLKCLTPKNIENVKKEKDTKDKKDTRDKKETKEKNVTVSVKKTHTLKSKDTKDTITIKE
jgi:hypothetical protein